MLGEIFLLCFQDSPSFFRRSAIIVEIRSFEAAERKIGNKISSNHISNAPASRQAALDLWNGWKRRLGLKCCSASKLFVAIVISKIHRNYLFSLKTSIFLALGLLDVVLFFPFASNPFIISRFTSKGLR